MASLRFESDIDVIDLDEQFGSGWGFQAHARASGFGLPDAEAQWFDGASGGSVYRGRRVGRRDIDLPISILAASKGELEGMIDRLMVMLSSPFRIVRTMDDETSWELEVVHVGGGDYLTGVDTDGEGEFHVTLQLQSGWSEWRRITSERMVVVPDPEPGEYTYGTVLIDNVGSAEAWPIYKVQGPGSSFAVHNEDGVGFTWLGTLAAGESLTINTSTGTIVDGDGVSRYAELAPAPALKGLKPGRNSLTVAMSGRATGTSSVLVKDSPTPRRINEVTDPNMGLTSGTTWVRRNRCVNPTGAGGVGDWHYSSVASASIAYRSDQPGPRGTGGSVRLTMGGTASSDRRVSLYSAPATFTDQMTFSGYVRCKSTITKLRPVVYASPNKEAGSGMTLAAGDLVDIPAGEWVRISITVNKAAGDHPWVRFGVRADDAIYGDWMYLADVLIEDGPDLRDYFAGDAIVGTKYDGLGLTRQWDGTAHQSTSSLMGAACANWTSYNGMRAWVNGGRTYVLSSGDSGYIRGPNIAHTWGTPWVGSVRAQRISGDSEDYQSKVRLILRGLRYSDNAYSTTARSGVTAAEWWGGSTVSAAGGGSPIPFGYDFVYPLIEVFSPDHIVAFDDLLMEKSTSLGPYFDGTFADTEDGIYEFEGAYPSRSFVFDARVERASLTSIEYQPRRWAVI